MNRCSLVCWTDDWDDRRWDEMKREELSNFLEVLKERVQALPLSSLSDEELREAIEKQLTAALDGRYLSLDDRLLLARQVFSSIRGFGLLDAVLQDESVTEVMINGTDDIFVEKNGSLHRLDARFESRRRLEDIIQRIVGLAGREVNQANPIVDTRLPDGSRVNVVLEPVSLIGPVVTIRKFTKTPMTVERLIQYGSLTPQVAEFLETLVRAK